MRKAESFGTIRELQTFGPHKRDDFLGKAAYYGMPADVNMLDSRLPERDRICGFMTGPLKVQDFSYHSAEIIERRFSPGEKARVLVAVDTAGYIGSGSEIAQLTTCRGRSGSLEKLEETLSLLRDNVDDTGNGKITYIHSTGYGTRFRGDPQLHEVGALVASAVLLLSPALIELLGSQQGWEMSQKIARRKNVGRPVITANANGALDMTAAIDLVRSTRDEDVKMVWRSDKGESWEVSGVKLDRGMRGEMRDILRGIPWVAVKHLAALPV
jgi:hypothetical protein